MPIPADWRLFDCIILFNTNIIGMRVHHVRSTICIAEAVIPKFEASVKGQ